ncbi:MAG: SDR family NAD(P)-dependent oxidoreductase [Lapillicoccus sp.]
MRFEDRVALVTGGANGIGRATVARLYAEGARVVVADREVEQAQEVAAADPDRLLAVECDVTRRPSVDAAVAAGVGRFGGLDVLVTVAGGSMVQPDFLDLPDESWQSMIDLNLTGTMRCVRAAAPHLLDSTRGPAIVLVSSVNGLADFGDEAYSSAKAALPTLAKNLAVRFGSRGIRVNVVAPGTIRTRVWDAQPGSLERLMKAYPLGRIGEPEEVAAAIAFLCSSDASWVTGITLPVDGGALAGLSHVLGQL